MKRRTAIQALVALSGLTITRAKVAGANRRTIPAARAATKTKQFLLVDHETTFKDNWNRRSPDWIEEPWDGFLMLYRGNEFGERRSREIPDDWTQPIDYTGGTVHVRVEVLDKPNDSTPSGLILRLLSEQHGGNHSLWFCTRTCKFNAKGVYHFTEKVADGERHYGPLFRFDRPLYEMQLIVTDDTRGIVHKGWEKGWKGEPDLGPYLPLTVRFSAFVTAPGAKFSPPAWW